MQWNQNIKSLSTKKTKYYSQLEIITKQKISDMPFLIIQHFND